MLLHFLAQTATTDSAPEALSAETSNPFVEICQKFGIAPGPLAVQIIGFCVLALVVWYFGFRPLLKTVAERQKKIEDGLKFSDEMKARLEKSEETVAVALQKAAAESSEILEAARKSARETVEKAGQDAIARAEQIEQRAQENIAREREKMFAELKSEVAALVVETTAKLIQRDIAGTEKEKLAVAAAKEIEQGK